MAKAKGVDRQFYTMKETAEILGLVPTQIHYRMKTGKIKGAQKVGWFWIFEKEEIDRLLEEQDTES